MRSGCVGCTIGIAIWLTLSTTSLVRSGSLSFLARRFLQPLLQYLVTKDGFEQGVNHLGH
jgi:hypothetical protein